MVADPFSTYLKRASDLFESGDIVQAGQIWQAILKKKPDHEIARAGLYKVKLYFDARATQDGLTLARSADDGRSTQAAPPVREDPEIAGLLAQGCTLYDAGHIEDAITKWVQVLFRDPGNSLARGYVDGARRTLEQAPALEEAPAPAPAPAQAEPSPADAAADHERLLRDGCTLFDMGQIEDAMRKWEELLVLDPGHPLAWAYLQDARKALGLPAQQERTEEGAPEPAATQADEEPADERLERLLREGVQLYDMGMAQEAAGKWREILEIAPGHADAEAYLAMARRDQEAPVRPTAPRPAPPEAPLQSVARPQPVARIPRDQAPARIALEPGFGEPLLPVEVPPTEPVSPPAMVSKPQKAREGLDLPELLRKISLPGWMASPVFILGIIAGLVILIFGLFYYMRYRKDKALDEAVAALKASAVMPVERDAEVAKVRQTPEEIQKEAQDALGDDPLLAYFRAAELVRLNPVEAAYTQLRDQAKAGLARASAQPAVVEDFEKLFHARDFEAAERTINALLGQNPDDGALKVRAARLCGTMAEAYASREMWTDAEARLRRGRALVPEDGAWNVKLLLLAHIQAMPRRDRTPWIPLLG